MTDSSRKLVEEVLSRDMMREIWSGQLPQGATNLASFVRALRGTPGRLLHVSFR